MEKILTKLHIFFFLWVAWQAYTSIDLQTKEVEALRSSVPTLEGNITREKRKKERTKDFLQDVSEAKDRIESVATEVERLQRQLPADVSDPENLALIKGIADQMNIKNVVLAPGNEEDKGFYLIKNYNFKGVGTFLQFLLFFEKIAENERLLNINEFELTKVEEERRGRFQLLSVSVRIGAYKHNPNYREDRGIDRIEDAFSANDPAPARKKRRGKRAAAEDE